jgi:hypothetical protein
VLRAVLRQPFQGHVELAAVGEPGQRIVQRIVLDAVLGKLELDVLADRLVLGGFELRRHQRVFGDVEGHADDFQLTARRLREPCQSSGRSACCRFRRHAADERVGVADPLEMPGALYRQRPVFRDDARQPCRFVHEARPRCKSVELVHPVIPVGAALVAQRRFPDAALVGIERQVELAGQLRQFGFAMGEFVERKFQLGVLDVAQYPSPSAACRPPPHRRHVPDDADRLAGAGCIAVDRADRAQVPKRAVRRLDAVLRRVGRAGGILVEQVDLGGAWSSGITMQASRRWSSCLRQRRQAVQRGGAARPRTGYGLRP